jgi:hypothetical protein
MKAAPTTVLFSEHHARRRVDGESSAFDERVKQGHARRYGYRCTICMDIAVHGASCKVVSRRRLLLVLLE